MNIAIIEDSRTIAHILLAGLEAYGFIPTQYASPDFKVEYLKSQDFKLVIVNSKLDEGKAADLIDAIKYQNIDMYVFGIHSRGDWQDRVDILRAGADDVISYPFAMQEFIARIQAILRRPHQSLKRVYQIKDITLDPANRVIHKRKRQLILKKKEFSLLEYLMRNKGRPISRSELLDNVWDYRQISGSNTVDVHVSNLRKNIGDPSVIRTVHGFGYQLNDIDVKYEKSGENELNEMEEKPPELD